MPTVSGMLIRSAPALSAAVHTFLRNSILVRVASIGENSQMKPWFLMYWTDSSTAFRTCSGVMFKAYFICTSEVEMNVWIEFTSHAMAASMSLFKVRVTAHISASKPAFIRSLNAFSSPSEADGKPASIASTPSLSSWLPISIFSSGVRETPGVCSPSLSVVSKILIYSNLTHLSYPNANPS